MANSVDGFRQAMNAAGIRYAGDIHPDGRIHRFAAENEKSKNNGYILFQSDRFFCGSFWSWRTGIKETWNSVNGDPLSKEEKQALQQKIDEAKKLHLTEKEQIRKETREKSQKFLNEADQTVVHPYLDRKKVGVYGEIRLSKSGLLLLPLRDINGTLQTLQLIAPDKRFSDERDKTFLYGGETHGCFYEIPGKDTTGPIVIGEGYATGATIHEATGWRVICAMSAGNLPSVAKAFRQKFHDRTIIIAADNDRFTQINGTPTNPGVLQAQAAAKETKAIVVVPEFSDSDFKSKDFNDLALTLGIEAVQVAFRKMRPMSFLTPSEILSIKTTTSVLLGDHVLCRGSLASFMAAGGTGKSSIIMQMAAACIAQHEKFLAWTIHPDMHDLKWFIVQAENSTARLQTDLSRIRAWIGPNFHKKLDAQLLVLAQEEEMDAYLDLDNPEVVERIKGQIEFFSPDIVIFDALYNFTLRELSKGAEMLTAVSACTRLSKHGNPRRTPILLHHALPGSSGSSKTTGFDRANFGRDSKVLHQLCRSVVNIAQAAPDDPGMLLVSCGKCSDAREFPPFVIRRNEETLIFELDEHINVEEVVSDLKNANSNKTVASITQDRVRELTDLTGINKPDLAKRIMDDCGCNRPTAYRHIKKALFAKIIRPSKDPNSDLLFRN